MFKAPLFWLKTEEMCQFKGTRIFGCQATETAKAPKIVVQSTRQLFCQFLTSSLSTEWKIFGPIFLFWLHSCCVVVQLGTRLKGVQCWVLSRCFAVTVTVTYWRNRKLPGFVPSSPFVRGSLPLCLASLPAFSFWSTNDLCAETLSNKHRHRGNVTRYHFYH